MGLVNKRHSLIGNLAQKHHLKQTLIGYVFQRLPEIPAERQKHDATYIQKYTARTVGLLTSE